MSLRAGSGNNLGAVNFVAMVEQNTLGNFSLSPFPGSTDYGLEVSRSNIIGVSAVAKFGSNDDIAPGDVPEDIWDFGGIWVPPLEARLHNITSTSINDIGIIKSSGTATGGTITSLVDSTADFISDGVAVGDTVLNDITYEHSVVVSVFESTLIVHQTVHRDVMSTFGDAYRVVNASSTGSSVTHVFGLDEDMLKNEEFVVNNGTANVSTLNKYWRINRMHTDGAANRSVTNIGDITATAQIDGTITSQISSGQGQTLQAIYTVAGNNTAYMHSFYATMTGSNIAARAATMCLHETIMASIDGAGERVRHSFGLNTNGTSSYQHLFNPPKKFEARTDIVIRCLDITATSILSAGFDLTIVEDGF